MTARTPFDAALDIASHARNMGFRRIAVRQSKVSRSCYVWFTYANLQCSIRCSDHPASRATYDFNLPDLADIQPALVWMRALKGRKQGTAA